jgi:predicted TIM-barrel fold metal-dependent hydrolase
MYGQFFLLFALIIVGYYCNKKGWLNRETNKNMSSMVMHVMIPAMLISTISTLQVNDRILKVLDKVGYSKLVLGHFGAHKMWGEVLEKLAGLDVFFDTAFTLHEIDKNTFCKIVEKHGAEKILFATDCPWRDIVEDKRILQSYGLDKDVEEKIFYKNALKLLNL